MAISSCSNSDIHQSKDLNGTSNYHSGARMFSVLTMHFQLHSPHDSHQYLACFKIFTFSTSHEFNNVMQETDSKLKVSPRCVKQDGHATHHMSYLKMEQISLVFNQHVEVDIIQGINFLHHIKIQNIDKPFLPHKIQLHLNTRCSKTILPLTFFMLGCLPISSCHT